MSTLQILVISLVQGITEFLPISSSAHLRMIPVFADWPDQGLMIDLAAHVGTLFAVLLYFRRDTAALVVGVFDLARGRASPDRRLLLLVALGTVPLVIAGALLLAAGYEDGEMAMLRSIEVIAWATIGFGIVLYLADRTGATARSLDKLTVRDTLLIGLAQILALIPGTSRSGITMTAARFLGFDRTEAARYALLLSIPAILASAGPLALKVAGSGDARFGSDVVLTMVLSFAAALVSIALMMRWLQRASFTPFVVYRVVLGAAILVWLYA